MKKTSLPITKPAKLMAVAVASSVFGFVGTILAAEPVFDGGKSTWHDGFVRYDFVMDDQTLAITPFTRPEKEGFAVGSPAKGQRRCIVVVPNKPAPGNPWSWQGCYWDHQPQAEVELLHRGFYIAFITPDGPRMSPAKQWDAWYAYLTEKQGLSRKPAFVGMSKGGVNEYTWAGANPDKVSSIYADNPGIYPEDIGFSKKPALTGIGAGTGEAYAWAIQNPDKVSCIYGENPAMRSIMTSEQGDRHLADKLEPLAKAGVPILHLCGSLDPWLDRDTRVAEKNYRALGGNFTVIIRPGEGHFATGPQDPRPSVDFIVGKTN